MLKHFLFLAEFLLLLEFLSVTSATNLPLKIPKAHRFPVEDEYGNQLANEFQLLRVERIQKISDVVAKLVSTPIEADHPLLQPLLDGIVTNFTYEILSVSPLVITNDEIVNVSYYSSHPSFGDWIAAYAPLDLETITTTVPVKFGYCDEDPKYKSTGYGTLSFNMTNLRSSFGFVYYTNKLKYPIYVNSSTQIVNFTNINQPLRPRVVATGNTNILNLVWSSATSNTPTLKWGTSSGVYTNIVPAVTSTIPQSAMCGSPANSTGWREVGLIHTAPLIGMNALANENVFYLFGDEETNDFSSEHTLLVPPLPGTQPKDRPTTVILFDDLGRGSTDMTYTWNEYGRPAIFTAMAVGYEVSQGLVDAIYHGGDISYATGFEAVWDFFLDMIAPMASGTVYLTTVGNHESDWPGTPTIFQGHDSGGECGVMSTRLLPQPAPSETNKPWWSYDVGIIHFVGLSSEHNFSIGSEQYLWLEADLKSVNRTISPWIIFGGHRAMYINSDYGGDPSSDIAVMNLMIDNLEPLLWKYRVNIGFYGHNHVVNRNAAVLNRTVIQHPVKITNSDQDIVYVHHNPQATVQMVVGTGGADFTPNAVTPPPDWNELFFYEWGYARVTAVNESYLDWKWFNSITGKLVDHMVITQVNVNDTWVIPPDESSDNSNSNGLSEAGVIAIGVLVGFFGALCLAGLILYFRRKQIVKNDISVNLVGAETIRSHSTNIQVKDVA